MTHLAEEIIENYAAGKLPEPELEIVEEHLLICVQCQDQVEQTHVFIQAFRSASKRLEDSPPSAWDRVRDLVTLHRGVTWTAASAFAAVVLMFGVVPYLVPIGSGNPQRIELSAVRGADTSASHAKTNAPIDLQLDVSDLPASSLYTIEVVDSNGQVIHNFTNEAKSSKLAVSIAEPLPAGQYWVRVYGNSLKTELLREYGLKVD